jgi:hypothetical protein
MVAAHPRRKRCAGCGRLPRRGAKHAGSLPGSMPLPHDWRDLLMEQMRKKSKTPRLLRQRKAGFIDPSIDLEDTGMYKMPPHLRNVQGLGLKKRRKGAGNPFTFKPGQYMEPMFPAVEPSGPNIWVYDHDAQGRVIGRHEELPPELRGPPLERPPNVPRVRQPRPPRRAPQPGDTVPLAGGVCTMGCKTRRHRKGCGLFGTIGKFARKVVTPSNLKKVLKIASQVAPIIAEHAPEKWRPQLKTASDILGAAHSVVGGKVEEEWNPSGAVDGGYKKINGKWYQNTIAGLRPIRGEPPGYKKDTLNPAMLAAMKARRGGGKHKRKGGSIFDTEFDRVDPIDRTLWNKQKRTRVSTGHASLSNSGFY